MKPMNVFASATSGTLNPMKKYPKRITESDKKWLQALTVKT